MLSSAIHARIHPDRALGGDQYYCDYGGDVDAGDWDGAAGGLVFELPA